MQLGLSVVILIVYAWVNRKAVNDKRLSLFFLLFFFFFFIVMALGPHLHVAGQIVSPFKLPYAWLGNLDACEAAVRMSRSHDGDGEFVRWGDIRICA